MNIKTTISTNRNVFDKKGNYLPIGNYYFLITEMKESSVNGIVSCKGEFGEFTFDYKKFIKMMSVAQARLGRRAGLEEEGMPTYMSPVQSPSNAFYNTNNIVQYYDENSIVYKNKEYFLPSTTDNEVFEVSSVPKLKREYEKCVICLDEIKNKKKTLTCMHIFHKKCINEWLFESDKCPVCRTKQPLTVITNNSDDDEADDEMENSNNNNNNIVNRIIRPNTIAQNRIVSLVSSLVPRNNSPRTSLVLGRRAVENIRRRYSYKTKHNYNLRPRR